MARKRIGSGLVGNDKWRHWGFLPLERKQLRHITWDGVQRTYLKAMIRHRISVRANAIRYKWLNIKYHRWILEDYKKFGLGSITIDNFWAYFYHYKDDSRYPWIGDTPRPPTVGQPKGKEYKKRKTTPLQQINAKINDIQQNIVRAINRGDQKERRKLEIEQDRLDLQRRRLKGEI